MSRQILPEEMQVDREADQAKHPKTHSLPNPIERLQLDNSLSADIGDPLKEDDSTFPPTTTARQHTRRNSRSRTRPPLKGGALSEPTPNSARKQRAVPLEINSGRPDLAALIDSEIEYAAPSDRISIGFCGAGAMGADLKRIVSQAIRPDLVARGELRRNLELTVEEFVRPSQILAQVLPADSVVYRDEALELRFIETDRERA